MCFMFPPHFLLTVLIRTKTKEQNLKTHVKTNLATNSIPILVMKLKVLEHVVEHKLIRLFCF